MQKVNMTTWKKQNAIRSFEEILQSLIEQKDLLKQEKMQKLQSSEINSKCLNNNENKYMKINDITELIACERYKFKTSRKGAM